MTSIVSEFFYLFFIPEMKGLALEEVAVVFGDVAVSDGKEGVLDEEKANMLAAHIEEVKK